MNPERDWRVINTRWPILLHRLGTALLDSAPLMATMLTSKPITFYVVGSNPIIPVIRPAYTFV